MAVLASLEGAYFRVREVHLRTQFSNNSTFRKKRRLISESRKL